jgi:hypothetical protein
MFTLEPALPFTAASPFAAAPGFSSLVAFFVSGSAQHTPWQ